MRVTDVFREGVCTLTAGTPRWRWARTAADTWASLVRSPARGGSVCVCLRGWGDVEIGEGILAHYRRTFLLPGSLTVCI